MKSTRTTGFRAYLATSFLGAFNDNFFKLLLTCYAMTILPEQMHNTYVPLAGGVFVLPFLVCSSYAGWFADFKDKKSVMIWSKWSELAIMALGLLFFCFKAVYALLAVLFLMGAQSAMYSPAKYGYLPETLPERELADGNGATQLATFIAIIAGTATGGFISDRFELSPWIGSALSVAIAAIGVATSKFIGKTPNGNPNAKFTWNPIGTHIETIRIIHKNPQILLSLFGATYFWFFSALYQNNLPLFIRNELKLGDRQLGYTLGAVGLGIGIGCAICGKLSKGKIKLTMVIPGCLAMSATAILIGIFCNSCISAVLFSLALGISAGFFQLPLATALQHYSPADRRGGCLALANAVDCISMLSAYVMQWFLLRFINFAPSRIFSTLGVISIAFIIIWRSFQRKCKFF